MIAFDGERYAFVAPLVAEAAKSACLTRGQLQTLRRRAVTALAGREDLESRVLRVELWAHVEPGREAAEEADRVEQAAIAAGATRSARRAHAAAERARARPA